jgi:ATP-dependent Clp protease protease subunit
MLSQKEEFGSELHTLYTEEIPEKKITIDKSKHLYRVIPQHKRYRIYIGRFFELKKGLHAVIDELKRAKENDYLELIINSPGGMVNEGMLFYNIIQEKFYQRVITYLNNSAYSMGALLFCMGDKRVIYPYSDLMFHTYAHGVAGKGDEVKMRVEHRSKILENFLYDLIVEKGFLTQEEYRKMIIGKDYWLNAKELCKRGIATHVIIQGKEITAKEYLKLLKNQKKEEQKEKN